VRSSIHGDLIEQERKEALERQEREKREAQEQKMLDDAWRNRFKGDDTFARVRDDARLVRSITSTQAH